MKLFQKKEKVVKEKPEKQTSGKAGRIFTTVGKYVTAVLVLVVLLWFAFVCEVREGECAVILRFGAVRQQITQSGVYLKLPWPFETVVTYDGRLQYLESNSLETTTSDKRNVILQSYIVWKIDDPVLYHTSVGAQGTLDSYIRDQVFSATNSTMGTYKMEELVSLETESIKIDQIQEQIFNRVHEVCLTNYGVDVTDVSILRLTLPETNLQAVFDQMKADRQKDIDIIIANAQKEANRLTTEAALEASQILADGVTEAAQIKAQTETEVAKIYAEAQAANLELFQFLKNLDAMLASVDDTTVLVVKADEYPFNVLTQYSQHMSIEGNATVVNDLSYILSKLPEADRQALINAVSRLISNAAGNNGIAMN